MRIRGARRLAGRLALGAAACVLAANGLDAHAGPPRPSVTRIDARVSVRLVPDEGISLWIRPERGDGWMVLTRTYCDASVGWKEMRDAAGASDTPQRDARYRVPFAMLSEDWKSRALLALFPEDGFEGTLWVHRPEASPVETYGEGLWQVAEWFTGDGGNFRAISRSSASIDPLVQPGEELRFAGALLRPGLRRRASEAVRGEIERMAAAIAGGDIVPAPPEGASPPPADAPAGAEPRSVAGLTGADGELVYEETGKGRFAVYELKPGEALYSAVVVRFTGRLDPEEVNDVSGQIAEASGISDVTDIAIGHSIRIPMDLILPEFLPAGDSRREEFERNLAEAGRYENPARTLNLKGVHVILDAGHGGVDVGAIRNGVNEHEFVYDIMCRVKRELERSTAAKVHPVIVDRRTGFKPRDSKSLSRGGPEVILTTPNHLNSSSAMTRVGVNLRWYLANSIYRRLIKQGVPAERIVFMSLHADSLHQSIRGGMVYIPGERYRRGTMGSNSRTYRKYREVREKPHVKYSRSQNLKSEGLSRKFANRIIEAMTARGLRVHPHIPVRDRIIRYRRSWVPAVLRGNAVPVKVLVEMANLNNSKDAALMKDFEFREKAARVLVDALEAYFGRG